MRKNTILLVIFIAIFWTTLSACGSVPQVETNLSAGGLEITANQSEVIPIAYAPTQLAPSSIDLQSSLVSVYQRANPAVVYILTATGSGSGFVYDTDGHIVTNNHVVSAGNYYEIVFASGDRQRGSLVGVDPDSDLAVLKVEKLPAGVTPLPLADIDNIQVGQIVVAIGNPFGEQGSMSMGIISGVGRSLPGQRTTNSLSTYSLPEVIQTDAPINPGNSGGPLLNLDGEVIGVNSAIASDTGTNSGVGFSIPVSAVQKIVPSLIQHGKYEYSYMGVGFDNEITLDEQASYGVNQTQGAYVLNVNPGSPADLAGLSPADTRTGQGGDLIIAIDGNPVNNFAELNSYLVFHTSPGQTVEMTILRGGRTISLSMTLGARP